MIPFPRYLCYHAVLFPSLRALQAIIHYLLTRFREFSDWGQCAVLDLIAKYTPANEDELFGMMNLLDPALKVRTVLVKARHHRAEPL